MLKTKPVDQKSRALVQKRDIETDETDEKVEKKHFAKRLAALKKDIAKPKIAGRRPKRKAAMKQREDLLKRIQQDREMAKVLGE